MTDDQPLDLDAVAADDAALEALRADAGDDPALVLLRELLLDVERDLPHVPVGHGSTVLTLAVPPSRRTARRGTVVAVLSAGVLSLGGAAAASTFAPADSPLHGLGEAFRSAAGAVVGAVSPPTTAGRSTTALPTATASPTAAAAPVTRTAVAPRTPTPGAAVSAASRSRAAARQVDQLLDEAAALLKAGRTTAATGRLDLAERKLADVLPADRTDLPARLSALRDQVQEAMAPKPAKAKPAPKQDAPAQPKKAEAPEEAPQQDRESSGASKRDKQDKPKDGLGQLSSDASMKPRA